MGLLLSVLITCVGVLEVIACYTQFRIGTAYNECKSNLRDVAKYYAVELRKHELHFEPGPENGGPSTSQDTLSELMSKRTVRIQERSQLYSNGQIKNGQILSSSSVTPENGTPNPAANLIAPRNSICGYDSPTVQTLTPELDITEAVEKIQNLDMTRKSRSHISRKTGLEVVEKDFWRSRSPSPYPESKDSGVELIHTPSIKKYSDVPTLLENSDIEGSFPHSPVETVDKDFWNKPQMLTQESWESTYSKTDLEVQNITENMQKQPETFFGITEETAENEETKFDEAFLRSLDGVNRSSKCDDRRRSFRKKRNSSSTSSRASEISRSSKDVLDDIEKSETDNKKISPLTEEEIVTPEKCDSITSPVPKEEATFSKQEQTLFQANVAPNTSQQESSAPGKNICFTEKVKDLEISVQLLVTVKGTNQGDKMEYTTTINQDKSQKAVDTVGEKEEITKTTEEKSEFGNVKTSVTYGNSITPNPPKTDIKDLQISSQSLIHAERTTLDDVASTEAEFLKLYESYTELPDGQKDQFLKIIGQTKPEIENIENISDEPKSNNTKLPEKIEVSKTESDNKNESRVGRTDINILDISVLDNQTDNKLISSKEKWDQAPIGKNGKIEEQIVTQVSAVKPTINKEIIDKESPETEPKILSCETENLTIHEKLNNEITTNVNTLQTEVPTVETESNEVLIKSEIKKESIKIEEAIKVKPETKIIEEPQKLQTNEKSTKPEKESSSESSSTPSTVIENKLRRAAKTSFEDASSVQNQEMLTRRVSNHEISPKQASQAFWLIFSAEYTNAMEKDWHGQHFSCWQCDESLTGQRYVLRDDHPYCVKCYEQVFANPCEKCNRIIGIDSKDLSYKDKHWHEACFQCTTCNESLVDKQFGAKGEKIYCGNCYDKQFASRCDGCGKIFHAGTKKMEYKNRQWHEQCFKCCKCETPIGTKSFIPREKDIYCAGCYEEKFATRCVKCDKAIQSGGVTYKNEPWHRECFTCTHCNKNLAGQRFTSRDDKPCCAECFGRLFAKRCTSCSEPITGIGGTRFISFEDRHWHNDCFICASCSTSLVGRGFITDEDKIICPECAKERFM